MSVNDNAKPRVSLLRACADFIIEGFAYAGMAYYGICDPFLFDRRSEEHTTEPAGKPSNQSEQ